MEDLKSRFYDDVDKKCPLNVYPRPQFERNMWVNLNGEWDFQKNKSEEFPDNYTGKIIVPFAPESMLSGVHEQVYPDDYLWYRKKFTLEKKETEGKEIILNFGAVDYICNIFVNGHKAGSHRGGYNDFSVDITDFTEVGQNEITVMVQDPTDEGHQQRGKQSLYSHGFWYTSTSGIWQTVWLEFVDKSRIKSVKFTPDIDSEIINIKTEATDNSASLSAEISFDENVVFSGEISADENIKIENPKLWSPEEPNLYCVKFKMTKDGDVTDEVKSYFGMRKFSLQKDEEGYTRLCLNNKIYFMTGLLDQGYYPDSGLTPPTDEAMKFDISEMKRLGFNMLRKHIKREPARWYYYCDKLGMLVWQDMISGGKALDTFHAGVLPNIQGVFIPVADFSMRDDTEKKYKIFNREKPEWREEFKSDLREMVNSLYNTVSICTWVPFNEGWGQFDAKRIAAEVKKQDPTRFVDHASGWYDEGGGDFRSEHRYILPVQVPKKDGRAFVLSEFGGYSQIIDGHVWNKKKSFGYQMYSSKEKLTKAYKKLYSTIIDKIDKGLCASVYTQVTDVEYEVNGIMTYDRKLIKIDEDTVKRINDKLKKNN